MPDKGRYFPLISSQLLLKSTTSRNEIELQQIGQSVFIEIAGLFF